MRRFLTPKSLMFASVLLGGALVMAGVIIIERAMNDLFLDYLHPLIVMGIGLIVTGVGLTAVILRRIPSVPFILVLMIGCILIIIGIALAINQSDDTVVIISLQMLSLGV